MKERRALVIDDDKDYAGIVVRALATLGLEATPEVAVDGCLERIADLRPEIVFIAADLPGAFTACERIKTLSGRILVALVARDVPSSEMESHQKLPHHADLYLEKGQVASEADLLRKTEELLAARPSDEAPPEPSADEIDRLRREFDDRREARMSQSSGNLALQEQDAGKDGEIARLQQDVLAREQRIVAIQRKRHRIVSELADALRQTRKSYRDLEVLLDSAQSTADTALGEREELERVHEMEHQEHAEALSHEEERRREAESSLSALKVHFADVQRRSVDDLAALRAAQGEMLESREAEQQAALRRIADEFQAFQISAEARERELRHQYEARLSATAAEAERLADESRRALREIESRLRAEKDEAVATLHAARGQALAAQDKDHVAALRRVSEDLTVQKARLDEVEAASRKQAEAHEQALLALAAAHAQQLSTMQQEHQAFRATSEKKEQEIRQQHETRLADAELASRREDAAHQQALHALEVRLAEEKQQAVAALEAAQALALAESERLHRAALQQVESDFAARIVAADKRDQDLRRLYEQQLSDASAEARTQAEAHRQALAALEAARAQALAAQDKEHAALLRRAAEDLTAQKGVAQQKQDAVFLLEARLAQAESAHADALKQAAAAREAAKVEAELALTAASAAARQDGEEQKRIRAAQEAQHAREIAAKQEEHAAALQAAEEARQRLEADAAARARALSAQYDERIAERLAQAAREAEDASRQATAFEERLRSEHAREMAALEAAHAEKLRQAHLERETLREASERKAIDLRREHEVQQALLETRLRAELEEGRAAVEAARVQALAAVDREHQAALRRAADELVTLRASLAEWQEAVRQHEARSAEAESAWQQRADEWERVQVALEVDLRQEAAEERRAQAAEAQLREQALHEQYEGRLTRAEGELVRQAEEHRQALAALAARATAEKEQVLAALAEEREAAAQDAARKLGDLMLGVQQQEAELRQHYEEKLAARDAARVQALAAQDKEHVAAQKRLTEELQTLKAATRPRTEG